MLYFHKFVEFSKAMIIILPKIIYMPLFQQIVDSLKKIGLRGTLVLAL